MNYVLKSILGGFFLLLLTQSTFAQTDSTTTITDSTRIGKIDTTSVASDSILLSNGFSVSPFYPDTLFYIYFRFGEYNAEERSKITTKKLKKLQGALDFNPDSLRIEDYKYYTSLIYKDIHLLNITQDDADVMNETKERLAVQYRIKIINSLNRHLEETNLFSLLKKAGMGLIVLIILLVLIKLINRLYRFSKVKISEQEGKLIKGIKIRNYTLYDSHKEVKVLQIIANVLRWLIIIICIYIALPILFGIFPWTERLADTLFGFILNPLKSILKAFWKFLPNLFTIIVIFIVFRYILKLIKYLKFEIARGSLKLPGFYPDWANPTYHIIRILIIAFMVVVIFPYLPGSDSPVFKGVSVFLGFLFTFGSAGSLSNIVAGLVLTYMRLFRRGDRVKIGEVTGDVIEKSMLVTRVRTIKNEIISIPNSTVMNSHTVNYSSDASDKGLIIYSTVTIGYDVPWQDVEQALIDAATKTELILEDPKPFVLQTSLDDFYVSYQINAYTKEPNKQATIYSDLHKNIQDTFFERAIEIMSPHFSSIRDGNTPQVPKQYLPKDFKIPFFRINKDDN